jgi:putative (di)nucleoside polyphosphate hydrolase
MIIKKLQKGKKVSKIDSLPYRKGVGLMILNKECKVFVGKRNDVRQDAWQMPQGGVDDGESAEDAVFREMEEEIGNNYGEIIACTKKEYSYEIPDYLIQKLWDGKYKGQNQRWYLLRYLGQDKDININASSESEFKDWKWLEIEELVHKIIPFKRTLYLNVIEEFRDEIIKFKDEIKSRLKEK